MQIDIPYRFIPRSYQIPFLDAMDSGFNRACLIWHRRSGKTKTLINFTIKKAFQRVGVYYHAFPEYGQARKIVWDGIDNETGKNILELHIPKAIRRSTNKTEMKIELKNRSIYQLIGADNYDSLVGPNPVGLIFDEWAVSDKYPKAWDYFRPILVENHGWAVFPYTPRGRTHGWDLYQMAQKNERWFCQLLTVDDTKAISQAQIQAERESGMSEDMIQQEFHCSFLASTEDILIPFHLIQDALHRDIVSHGARIGGGDCARFGDDRSTLIIRQGTNIIHAEEWKGLDNIQLAGRYIDRYRTKFYDAIGIDVINMPGVYDLVHNAGVPSVPVNAAESPAKNPERFRKLRDELWWNLRDFFQENSASISRSIPEKERQALVADIQDIHYQHQGITQKIIIESKEEMKKRLGFSPDYGDALCYTFAPGIEMRIPESIRVPFGYVEQPQPQQDYNPLYFGLGDQHGIFIQ